jgi:PAS domain S-box-containing protein
MAIGVAYGYANAKQAALSGARVRLKLVAQNLSAALGTPLPKYLASRAAVAGDSTITGFLRAQTPAGRAAVTAALQKLRTPGEPELPIVLWSAERKPILQLGRMPVPANGRAGAAAGVLPPVTLSGLGGIGPFVTMGGHAYFWLVTAVRQGAATRGYIAELHTVVGTANGAQQLQALIGPDVGLFFSNTAGGPWIGLDGAVDPPPAGPVLSGAARYRRADGVDRLGHAAAIAGTPWSLTVEQPLRTVLARPLDFLRSSTLVALLLCLAGAVGAWRLSRAITGPLKELGASAEAIALGEYARRSPSGRADELGVLADRFNWMAEQVEATHGELAAQCETAQSLAAELEESNHELASTQSRLTAALRHGRMGTWVWDVAEDRIWVGEALLRLFGRAPGEVEHCSAATFVSFFHSDEQPAVQRALADVLATGRDYDIEARVPRPDGTVLWIESKGSVERDPEGRIWRVTGACVDVTERRQLEAQLRHSQRIESIGQLAGGVAHDFNNLLTVISGNTELLAAQHTGAEGRALIGEVLHAADRASALTRQLLAFSRQQVLSPKVVSLNAVIEGTESMLRRLLGEDVLLTMVLDAAVSPVLVDPGTMDQVLMNLAVNARDAMPRGGRLTVETAMAELGEDYAATHPEVTPGRYVRLSVTDTGSGMPAEVASRIFEPFFTTKAAGKGTGLGLAVVHGIVKQSGGHVQVYSERNVGTSFKIYLPPATAPVVRPAARPAAAAEPRGTGTVLVVEDEDAVRRLATRILATGGYTVVHAGSGEEALEMMNGADASVDLLLTDVVMPLMSGRELADMLRLRFPRLKILFSSGYTDDAVVRHGILESEVAFLQKPYTPSSLLERVRQVLGSV